MNSQLNVYVWMWVCTCRYKSVCRQESDDKAGGGVGCYCGGGRLHRSVFHRVKERRKVQRNTKAGGQSLGYGCLIPLRERVWGRVWKRRCQIGHECVHLSENDTQSQYQRQRGCGSKTSWGFPAISMRDKMINPQTEGAVWACRSQCGANRQMCGLTIPNPMKLRPFIPPCLSRSHGSHQLPEIRGRQPVSKSS